MQFETLQREKLTLPELVDEFFLDLQLQNQTEATIKTCRWHIGRFLKFLAGKEITDPEQITRELLREYQIDIVLNPNTRGRRYSPNTVNRYMGSVGSFVKFLKSEDQITTEPAQGITYAKIGRKFSGKDRKNGWRRLAGSL